MSDVQFYSLLMFWSGVLLTKVIFYFEKKWKEKEIYQETSASIIRFLYMIYLMDLMTITDHNPDSSGERSEEESQLEERMSQLTTLVISSFAPKQRSKLVIKSWKDAKKIINLTLKGKQKIG